GNQCLTFSETKLNWDIAVADFATNGGKLASLADPAGVQAHVLETYGDVQFWAGGSDTGQEKNWAWVTGEPFDDHFPWGNDQPNNGVWLGSDGDEEDCLMVNWKGEYNDEHCIEMHRYICEQGCTDDPVAPEHAIVNCSECR
ncbi:unnamed protein product, partial [Meganyctiphanes norvegica]